jgi:hypothetical protein
LYGTHQRGPAPCWRLMGSNRASGLHAQNLSPYIISDFLTNRASKSFRQLFFKNRASLGHPVIASTLNLNDSSCRLRVKLQSDEIFDEEAAAAYEQFLFERAGSMECVDLPISAKEFLGEERYSELIKVALDNVSTNRADLVLNWAESWDSDIDPESYFDTLTEKLTELASSIDEDLPKAFLNSLSSDMDDYLYGMRDEYSEKQSKEDREIEISGPTKAAVSGGGAAEIDAIFSDVADYSK